MIDIWRVCIYFVLQDFNLPSKLCTIETSLHNQVLTWICTTSVCSSGNWPDHCSITQNWAGIYFELIESTKERLLPGIHCEVRCNQRGAGLQALLPFWDEVTVGWIWISGGIVRSLLHYTELDLHIGHLCSADDNSHFFGVSILARSLIVVGCVLMLIGRINLRSAVMCTKLERGQNTCFLGLYMLYVIT